MALGVVASVTVAAGVAVAQGAASRAPSGGVLVATGQVADAEPGAEVRAYAWPSDRSGPALRRLTRVATGEVGDGGRFELRTASAELLERLGRHKRSVDLVVLAPTAGGWAESVFSSRVERRPDGRLAAAAAASGARSLPRVGLRSLAPPGATAASHACDDWGDVGAPRVRRVKTYKRPVVVGELNNAYPDTRASFTYGQRADSTISSALQLEGQAWRLHGSTEVANGNEVEIGPQDRRGRYGRRVRSNFYFGKYRFGLCPAPDAGSHYHRIKALSWSGGSTSRAQGGTLGVCYGGNDYEPGSLFKRSKNRAVTWTLGASVAGVGLNSRSGFSRWVRVAYRFGSGVRLHRLCGSGGRDETTAGRIYSGAGRPPT